MLPSGDGDLDGGQTDHIAAIVAQEVRVLAVGGGLVGPDLESPDMVADFDACRQPRLHQIVEISVDGGAIEPERDQLVGKLRMAQGRRSLLEPAENLEPRQGGAQARSTKALPQARRLLLAPHGRSSRVVRQEALGLSETQTSGKVVGAIV